MSLHDRILSDFGGNVCTTPNMFKCRLGDVWAGGREKERLMSLRELKKELRRRVPPHEVEEAFRTKTVPATGTELEYARYLRSKPTTAAAEVSALATSVEVEFGRDRSRNYVFSALPQCWYEFKNRAVAEKMFKFAVLKDRRGDDPLFERRWFLIVAVLTSSKLVLVESEKAGKVIIKGSLEPWLGSGAAVAKELFAGLKLAQVGVKVEFGSDSGGMKKVVNEGESACVVKVRNNRWGRPARNFKASGWGFKDGIQKAGPALPAGEKFPVERKARLDTKTTVGPITWEERLEAAARQLQWGDDRLDELVVMEDTRLF